MDVCLRPHLFVVIRSPPNFRRALCLLSWLLSAQREASLSFDLIWLCFSYHSEVVSGWEHSSTSCSFSQSTLFTERLLTGAFKTRKTWQLSWLEHKICLLCWKICFPQTFETACPIWQGVENRKQTPTLDLKVGALWLQPRSPGSGVTSPFQTPLPDTEGTEPALFNGAPGTGRPPVQLWQPVGLRGTVNRLQFLSKDVLEFLWRRVVCPTWRRGQWPKEG